jgi:molybdenum cofactor cytidylyltransferase
MTDVPAGSPTPSHQPTPGVGPFVCLILAAGQGQRFGAATKQLAELDGLPLIAHAVRTASSAGASRVVVVVGHDAGRVGAAARSAATAVGAPVQIVDNPAHAVGQSTSLLAGLRALDDDLGDPIAVLLADQPRIDPRTVVAVVAAVAAGAEAARVRYLDAVGHPVAFAPSLLPRLRAIEGDRGARGVLRDVDTVEVAHAGPVPRDVDTPADLAELARAGTGAAPTDA